MTNSIGVLRHQDYLEHKSSFEWQLNGSNNASATLELQDKRQYSLELQWNAEFNTYIYNFTVSLKLMKNLEFKPFEKISVYMSFKNNNVANPKFAFNLTQVNSKEMRSRQRLVFTSRVLCSTVDMIFEISCREYTSPVLVKDFTMLLNSGKYSDLTIDVRDKTFKVHKNIVCGRNLVLSKMVEVDMVEKQTNKITLNDWKPNIVEEFLIFVYTGTCRVDSNYIELFQLAHFLRQSDLEKIVEKYMKHNIKMDNFVLLFEIADLYELKDLYDEVEKFFCANKNECIKDLSFEPCLRKTIKVWNIRFVLDVAYEYKMTDTLRDAMEFVKTNYEKIAMIPTNRDFIKNKNDLLFQIFEHSVGYSPNQQK